MQTVQAVGAGSQGREQTGVIENVRDRQVIGTLRVLVEFVERVIQSTVLLAEHPRLRARAPALGSVVKPVSQFARDHQCVGVLFVLIDVDQAGEDLVQRIIGNPGVAAAGVEVIELGGRGCEQKTIGRLIRLELGRHVVELGLDLTGQGGVTTQRLLIRMRYRGHPVAHRMAADHRVLPAAVEVRRVRSRSRRLEAGHEAVGVERRDEVGNVLGEQVFLVLIRDLDLVQREILQLLDGIGCGCSRKSEIGQGQRRKRRNKNSAGQAYGTHSGSPRDGLSGTRRSCHR